jgi:predicted nucleic acid binding AN1-type Zn finger protein
MLTEINIKNKEKCNYSYCDVKGSTALSLCNFCNSYFCNNHLRGIIHDCVLFQKNESNTNAYVKSKVNQKIEELEKKRNKKPKNKNK